MKRVYRLVASVLLLLVGITLTGCWDRTEVNDLAIVTGVALDRVGENAVELTVAFVVPGRITPPGSPGGRGGAQSPLTTKAAQGRTVLDATSRLQEKLSRRMFWAHNSVILVGDTLARDGVAPVVDFFTRHRQPRLRAVFAVVEGRAGDVLATISPIEQETATAIREMETFRTGVFVTMRDLVAMLTAEGTEPVAAKVGIVRGGATEPGLLGMEQGGQAAQADPPQPAITGAAIFKDDKLLGFLSDEETRGLLWLRDEIERATITVTLGESGKWVSFEFLRATTELKPRFETGMNGERIIMQAKIVTEDDLGENQAGVDAGDPEVLKILEEELRKTIIERIQLAANRVQKEFRSDVFGFGGAVRRADPQRWSMLKNRWDEVFPEVEIEFDVQAKILRTGLTSQPLALKKEELLKAEDIRRMLEGS